MAQDPKYDLPTYTPTARSLHWLIALLIFIHLPLGFYMTYRSDDMPSVDAKGQPVNGVWDALTGFLYSSHKLIGLTVLALLVLRLLYRLTRGAPRSDPSVPAALTGIGHLSHWLMYALLIAVAVIGLMGITYGDYLEIFGFRLPALAAKNVDLSKELFEWHETGAYLIIAVVALHILAVIYHRFVRKDRVIERMIPKRVA